MHGGVRAIGLRAGEMGTFGKQINSCLNRNNKDLVLELVCVCGGGLTEVMEKLYPLETVEEIATSKGDRRPFTKVGQQEQKHTPQLIC